MSFIFSFYLAEVYLFLKNKEIISSRGNVEHRIKQIDKTKFDISTYDKRTKFELFFDERKVREIAPLIHPLNWTRNNFIKKNFGKDLFPLSNISNMQNIDCNENGMYNIFKTDRHGFRNPDKVWDEENIEIIILGDSFAHGACVSEGKDIGSKIREITNRNVVNLAIGSTGPLIQYATLREYGISLKPSKVLWTYSELNDLSDLASEKKNEVLNNYLIDENFTQNLLNSNEEINKILKFYLETKVKEYLSSEYKDRIVFHSQLKNTFGLHNLKLYNLRNLIFNDQKKIKNKKNINSKNLDMLIDIVKNSNEKVKTLGGDFYFVYLPSFSRSEDSNYKKEEYEYLLKNLKKNNIKVIDIFSKLFKNSDNPKSFFPFEIGGHYNEKGYYEVSKIIIDQIYKK
ncbi:hypothetical protein [Candidatus Pelagibacter sp. Uisw_130]|uniref:hypothetical protein n=1 Tax=Candidatus Pelagibacter sp. Uisw_130 TaxID=3230989 RepID=UPI0039E73B60